MVAIKRNWERIINIGTGLTFDIQEIKKVRLVNSISLIGILAYGLWAITYAFDGIGITSLEATAAMVPLLVVLYINSRGWFLFGRYFHYFSTCLSVVYFGIAHGAKDGAEYLLFVTCIFGLMYFENRITLGILFLFNLVCFWIIKYSYTVMDPLVDSGNTLYTPNIISAFVVLFFIAYYFKMENALQEKLLHDHNEILQVEKEKSEKLLLNILPSKVAEELKKTGTTVPQLFQMATVVFTDFCDFTKISQTMSPVELVTEINDYFTAFDEIVSKYNIEKIKTIGDAYLCVSGIPVPNNSNPATAVRVAIEFQAHVLQKKMIASKQNKVGFDMRIGVHTGPVVAGIVGKSKFAYDIWGNTVNTASVLESLCTPGKINISQFTYEKIKDYFDVEPRGKVEAKHIGMIDMYYVRKKGTGG